MQPIELKGLQYLQLHRPDVGDLILTKMMRVDPQDREDIRFLFKQMPDVEFEPYLSRAALPDIPEIQHAFDQNRHWLVEELRR